MDLEKSTTFKNLFKKLKFFFLLVNKLYASNNATTSRLSLSEIFTRNIHIDFSISKRFWHQRIAQRLGPHCNEGNVGTTHKTRATIYFSLFLQLKFPSIAFFSTTIL